MRSFAREKLCEFGERSLSLSWALRSSRLLRFSQEVGGFQALGSEVDCEGVFKVQASSLHVALRCSLPAAAAAAAAAEMEEQLYQEFATNNFVVENDEAAQQCEWNPFFLDFVFPPLGIG